MNQQHDRDEQFLEEIQKKINKRSRGLYYNRKAKQLKRNLTITSGVMMLVLILILIYQFILTRQSQTTPIIPQKKGETVVPRQLPVIQKTLKYTLTLPETVDQSIKDQITTLLKPFQKKDDHYLIPVDQFKALLKQLQSTPVKLKRGYVIGDLNLYHVVFEKR